MLDARVLGKRVDRRAARPAPTSGVAEVDQPTATTTSGGNENEPHIATVGEIVVDAFDRSSAQQIWRATSRAEIDPQRIEEPALQASVARMMAPFPARTAQ
jgi:hypothetical protein